MPIKNQPFDFSDMSGGKNSALPRHAIAENQVADTLNCLHESIGVSRAPGYIGISASALFTTKITGLWTYIRDDGTETVIAVSNKKIYSIDVAAGTKTELYTLSGGGECYAVNAAGKLWIVNGVDFVKIESNLAVYRVQIAAPTGTSAAAVAGGSLPLGVYGVYVAYARKNAAGQYLYSLPYSLGNVTTSGGNLTVRVTAPNSADPQVTHKVVFMTDSGGAAPYYFGEVANATASVDISSTANRNGLVLMSTVSAANQVLPITPSGIFSFDDKIYAWNVNDRTIYWSLKTDVNPFDLERFLTQNFRTLNYTINSVFNIGTDLCFNSIGNGISKAISGDMSSVIKTTQKAFWFLDCKTPDGKSNVVFYKGAALGLTNDGVRFFDGESFSDDLSFNIKPDVDKIYAGSSSSNLPAAITYRRPGKRTEYRLSYRNADYGATGNNDQRVFNLDFYFDPVDSRKTWECWENGFSGMAINGRSIVGAQSHTDGGQIVIEGGVSDSQSFNRLGAFQGSAIFVKQAYLLTRTIIDDIDGITVWGGVYALATAGGAIGGNLIIFDNNNTKYQFSIIGSAAAIAVLPSQSSGLGLELPFVMAPQYPISTNNPMQFDCRGNSVALEISQIENDPD
jgi:hypothetical protein